jgi:hypothetical protein
VADSQTEDSFVEFSSGDSGLTGSALASPQSVGLSLESAQGPWQSEPFLPSSL